MDTMDTKVIHEKIQAALARQLRAHGVEATAEQVKAVSANLVYTILDILEGGAA